MLKIYYLCGSSNSINNYICCIIFVVICLKFTTFVVAATVTMICWLAHTCCDLLKIYYLCGSSNSSTFTNYSSPLVVICLKFTTFVVAATVIGSSVSSRVCCDLLKIYYLCGSSNSFHQFGMGWFHVVICLKFTTFVVAATVDFPLIFFSR